MAPILARRMSSPAPAPSAQPPWRAIAVGAAVVAAVVVLFLLLRSDGEEGGDSAPPAATATGATGAPTPVAATPDELTTLSERLDRSVYWVGAQSGATYELTETDDGQLYVRYLTGDARVGDERPDFLTVGTYPQDTPLATVEQAAERSGAKTEKLDDDGLAVANRVRPNSWYLAYPDVDELVEVFSPKAGRARELVRGGRVMPVPRG